MKYLLYLLLPLFVFGCAKQKQGLVLKGTLAGVANDQLVISWVEGRSERVALDTVPVINGEFTYENPNLKTSSYSFQLLNAQAFFSGILEPIQMNVTGNIAEANRGWLNVDFEGGRNNQVVKDFNQLREDLMKDPRFANYANCLERLKNSQSKEEADKIREEMEPLEAEFNTVLFPKEQELFTKNSDIYAVQTLMKWRFGQYADFLVELTKSIPDSLKNGYEWDEIKKEVDAYEATRPGKFAPDFTLYTPDSTALALSDLRGKYVLLDFWASWCAPCRASFPKLKELYKEYKGKGFEILSITNDSNHDQWKKAIEKDQTPWLHVADEFPKPPAFGTARVIGLYGFHYLPSTMLIDPDGKIVATLKGEVEIEAKLKEIFD